MPKKRHQSRYSKPPSVPPPSLSLSSSSRSTPEQRHGQSVNELLANLRRSTLSATQSNSNSVSDITAPSVPPTLRRLLRLPEPPAPPPRRPQRRDLFGRRPPPGPPPPPSWAFSDEFRGVVPRPSGIGHNETGGRPQRWPMPGVNAPGEGSLVDLVLRHMAFGWEQQRDWNRFYLYTLPSRLRSALLTHISELYSGGVSAIDLRLVLTGPSEDELAEFDIQPPDAHTLNSDFFSLDLTGSIGKSITVKELNELLFGPKKTAAQNNDVDMVLDSWDGPVPVAHSVDLLPNLTHLSLAIDPGSVSSVSWKQLLSLATKLPQLTELSLAGWPEPALTPNAKFANVTSPTTGHSVDYSSTGPYSHTLDNEWTEAILVLRRLSRSLYGLEYLDLTGCGDWFPALEQKSEGEFRVDLVDWISDWGKITSLRLSSGYELTDDSPRHDIMRISNWIDAAATVERHIRSQRAGRGRQITVERDMLSDKVRAVVNEVKRRNQDPMAILAVLDALSD